MSKHHRTIGRVICLSLCFVSLALQGKPSSAQDPFTQFGKKLKNEFEGGARQLEHNLKVGPRNLKNNIQGAGHAFQQNLNGAARQIQQNANRGKERLQNSLHLLGQGRVSAADVMREWDKLKANSEDELSRLAQGFGKEGTIAARNLKRELQLSMTVSHQLHIHVPDPGAMNITIQQLYFDAASRQVRLHLCGRMPIQGKVDVHVHNFMRGDCKVNMLTEFCAKISIPLVGGGAGNQALQPRIDSIDARVHQIRYSNDLLNFFGIDRPLVQFFINRNIHANRQIFAQLTNEAVAQSFSAPGQPIAQILAQLSARGYPQSNINLIQAGPGLAGYVQHYLQRNTARFQYASPTQTKTY